MQCKDFIDEHGFAAESLSNTALAARRVKDKGDIREAAIASERAAELYGLKILARLPIRPDVAAAVDAGKIEEVDFPELEEVAAGIAEALPVEKE